MREHSQGCLVCRPRTDVDGPEASPIGPAGIGAGQSLSEARRRPLPSEAPDGYRADRGNAWSYYVFRQGLRMIQTRGKGQRILINGVPGAIVLDP